MTNINAIAKKIKETKHISHAFTEKRLFITFHTFEDVKAFATYVEKESPHKVQRRFKNRVSYGLCIDLSQITSL